MGFLCWKMLFLCISAPTTTTRPPKEEYFVSDPALGIDWGVAEPIVSEKDMLLPTLAEFVEANQGGL